MDTGGKIRTGKILEQLNKHFEVVVIGNYDPRTESTYLQEMNRLCRRFIPVEWRETPRTSPTFYLKLLLQSCSPYPITVLNTVSKPLENKLLEVIRSEDFDVILCDFVQPALMLRHITNHKTILFQHNVESMITKRHVEQSTNCLAKLFWWLQWKKLYTYERYHCQQFDAVIAVSETDAEFFRREYDTPQVTVIPTGVDIEYYDPKGYALPQAAHLVFCGSMDWLPNEDGMQFFLREAWPLISRKIPHAQLTIVGRRPSEALQAMANRAGNVRLTGWVDDTRPYLAAGSVFIVPLRIGGGTRMKIYEAMAMQRAVVSTTIGAEGLPLRDAEHIVIRDDPQTFATACIDLIEQEEYRHRIAASGAAFVRDHFGWSAVATVFREACVATAEAHLGAQTCLAPTGTDV
jgi:glycosyltransferase involved in cell wall biosynthesis